VVLGAPFSAHHFAKVVVMGDKALVLLGAREFLLRAMTG
jgi:hypothetical protein